MNKITPKSKNFKPRTTALIIVILLFSIISCDRFTREFTVPPHEFIANFEVNATRYLRENNIATLINYFSPNYMHNGDGIERLYDFFNETWWSEAAVIIVTRRLVPGLAYSFRITDFDAEPYPVNITWYDYLQRERDEFRWIGNGRTLHPDDFVDEFTQRAIQLLKANEINSLMYYFSDYYLNNGMAKEDIRDKLSPDKGWSDEVIVNITGSSLTLAYSINIFDPINEIDLSWTSVLGYEIGRYIWVGNQKGLVQQTVLVQSFTHILCGPCRLVAQRLIEIKAQYSDNFIYINYHNDLAFGSHSLTLEPGRFAEMVYFGVSVNPTVSLQGGSIRAGAAATLTFESVREIMATPAEVYIENVSTNHENGFVSGTVSLSFVNNNLDFLYLHFAIVQEYSGYEYAGGIPATNIVRVRGKERILNIIDGLEIDFRLNYTHELTDDTYIVVWVQRMQDNTMWQAGDRVFNAVRSRVLGY